jgi:hypothetical protein
MDINLYINCHSDQIIVVPPLISEDQKGQTRDDFEKVEGFKLDSGDLYARIVSKIKDSLNSIRTIPCTIIYDKSYITPSLLNLGIKKFSELDKKRLGMASLSIIENDPLNLHILGYKKIRGGHQGIQESYSLVPLTNTIAIEEAVKKAITLSVANYK